MIEKILFACLSSIIASSAAAADISRTSLIISSVRVVGDYQGTTYDNTVEVAFSNPPSWGGGNCTSARVEIDANAKHLVSIAYLAITTGRAVTVTVDDTFPIRSGMCQVVYIDFFAQ